MATVLKDFAVKNGLAVAGTTDSSSSVTGAVRIAGGMGIAKKLYVGSTITTNESINCSTTSTWAGLYAYSSGNNCSVYLAAEAPDESSIYFRGTFGPNGDRWIIARSGSESGSNVGSDLEFTSWDDSGQTIATPLRLTRSDSTATFVGRVVVSASTTARSSLNIPQGTAPTSPVNGDVWTTSAGVYARINSATVGPLASVDQTFYIGTTQVAINRASAALTLAGLTLTTPTLGVATATSINKVAITAPATSATLTIANGKTLTASNTLTFTGTDSSSVAFGTGGTVAYTNVATLSSLVSIGTITTGTWNGTVVAGQYGGTGVANAGKTITLGGNLTTSGANNVTFTTTGTSNVTLPTTGTLATTAATTFSSLVTIDDTSTTTHTLNIASGATASGQTKTVNIGKGGLTGSTTNIYIGSNYAGYIRIGHEGMSGGTAAKYISIGQSGNPNQWTWINGGVIELRPQDAYEYPFFVMPPGSTPTYLEDGGMWTTTSGLFMHMSGVTHQFAVQTQIDDTQMMNVMGAY